MSQFNIKFVLTDKIMKVMKINCLQLKQTIGNNSLLAKLEKSLVLYFWPSDDLLREFNFNLFVKDSAQIKYIKLVTNVFLIVTRYKLFLANLREFKADSNVTLLMEFKYLCAGYLIAKKAKYIILLWWGYRFKFLLIFCILCAHEIGPSVFVYFYVARPLW